VADGTCNKTTARGIVTFCASPGQSLEWIRASDGPTACLITVVVHGSGGLRARVPHHAGAAEWGVAAPAFPACGGEIALIEIALLAIALLALTAYTHRFRS
jgi:hypothetical protein